MSAPQPPSEKQVSYVRVLQKKLRLPDTLLDNECVRIYGVSFAALDRWQVSNLIERMTGWEEVPARLRREQGQADLPGFGD